MIIDILKFILIASIAIPFIYMVFDVLNDLLRRSLQFYRIQLQPIRVTIRNKIRK